MVQSAIQGEQVVVLMPASSDAWADLPMRDHLRGVALEKAAILLGVERPRLVDERFVEGYSLEYWGRTTNSSYTQKPDAPLTSAARFEFAEV